jgi:hypothetical protein
VTPGEWPDVAAIFLSKIYPKIAKISKILEQVPTNVTAADPAGTT